MKKTLTIASFLCLSLCLTLWFVAGLQVADPGITGDTLELAGYPWVDNGRS